MFVNKQQYRTMPPTFFRLYGCTNNSKYVIMKSILSPMETIRFA